MKRKTKEVIQKSVGYGYMGLILALIYIPIIFLIIYSFIETRTLTGGGKFTFALYARLFKNEAIMKATLNTLIIALSSAFIAVLLGTVSAVGIFYLKRAKTYVNALTQITVVNAEIITAVAFLLFFVMLRQIGLPIKKGYATLIITHTIITLPYVILSVMPRLNQLNPNLYEAGLDLGCSPLRALFTVILPQLIPGMISGFALAFTLSLDDFIVSNLNRGEVQTISTLIYSQLTKANIDMAFRALSTIFFVVIIAVLIIVNILSRRNANVIKSKKGFKKEK